MRFLLGILPVVKEREMMSFLKKLIPATLTFLGVCAIGLGTLVEIPWQSRLALALLFLTTLGWRLASPAIALRLWKWVVLAAFGFTLAPFSYNLAASGKANWWDAYFAIQCWLTAAFLCLAFRDKSKAVFRFYWKCLVLFWGGAGIVIWLTTAYRANDSPAFFFGMALGVGCLIAIRLAFNIPPVGIMTINTGILLLALSPLFDLAIRAPQPSTPPAKPVFSRAAAQKDPTQFASWWALYLEQWNQMGKDIFIADPEKYLPFRLKPGSQGYLFQSLIRINSLGFRGREVAVKKGPVYRIVILGESTTFGCTLKPEDRPWPELLEQIIKERIKTDRPIEIINAGVPAYNLRQNLHRLASDILPLKPDMIISYHGYNGFKLLYKSYPISQSKAPPIFKARPLKILAKVEYRLKLSRYRWRELSATPADPEALGNPLKSDYAMAYRDLIQAAKTNAIFLAVANFSMAVNRKSSNDAIEFYRPGFPLVRWEITANTIHTLIVRSIARENPSVVFIDTHPLLDGKDERFIDLVHLTQAGRQQLAENVFASIKNALETNLLPPVQTQK
jgi:lysophospholipase L1-like esterase